MKALWELQQQGKLKVLAASPYSSSTDARYFPENQLLGFDGNRGRFMLHMLIRPPKTDILLVGHINLAPAALLFRLRYPLMKMIVIAHGLEVWNKLSGIKKWMLGSADQIISVSEFTKNELVTLHGIDANKIVVLPNCLDPFFQLPEDFHKPDYLLKRYGLQAEQKVLLTITRLGATEGYKGYDQVLKCIPRLLEQYPDLQYMLAGKCDAAEKQRIVAIAQRLGIEKHLQMPGFIADAELSDHYCLADVFVMPSKKEGFGIVFIEAMACGTPAIGGNSDGSPEALKPGELGYTTNPDNVGEITRTIQSVLRNPKDARELQAKTLEIFGYEGYRERLAREMQLNTIEPSKPMLQDA